MAHHSQGPDEEMGRIKELLGATGQFPHGKLTTADEGEIQFGITSKDNKIIIHFGKPVEWIGMTRDQARELARILRLRADMS